MKTLDVRRIAFAPSVVKSEQGIWVLAANDLPLPSDFKTELPARIAHFAPGAWGGNHRHRRQEALVGLSADLYFIWRDAAGHRHEAQMFDGKELQLFVIAPFVPHLVENRSTNATAILYELIDVFEGPAESLTGPESLR